MDPKTPSAPHDCPQCGEPAYIPFYGPAECTSRACPWFNLRCWSMHTMGLPDEEEGEEFDIEEYEPTQPHGLAAWLPSPKDLGPKSAKLYSDQQRLIDIINATKNQPGVVIPIDEFSISDEIIRQQFDKED
jgi:hypothetical protein